jgi:chromatin remodeling complex protein RSC6
MPKKVAQTPTEPKQTSRRKVSPQAETDEQAQAQAQVAPPKTRGKKAAVVADSTPAVAAAPTADTSAVTAPTADTTNKSRHAPTRESVEQEFNELVASIDEEIGKLRATASKSKGVKFLRTLNKRVKTLRTHALRVSRQRAGTRRSNTNSGFLKPVQISKDLAKFTGWDHSQLRSRVDVTKFICEYIKNHDLQDPADKRRIRVENDPSLKKLLKYEAGKDTKPLTYYSLQSYLKNHFTSPAVATPAQ